MGRLDTHLPLALFVVSVALIVVANSFCVFVAGALLGTSIGLYTLILVLRRPRLIRFGNTLAVALLFLYALGTVIYLFYSSLVFGHASIQSGAFPITYGQDDISIALAMVCAVCGLLLLFSRFERPAFGAPPRTSDFARPRVRLLMLICVAITLAALVTGNLGYGGISVNQARRISALGAISFLLAPVVPPLALLCLFAESKRFWKAVYCLIMTLVLACLFIMGRRVLLASIVMTIFTYALAGRRPAVNALARWIRNAVLLGALGTVVYFGLLFFYSVRLAGWEHTQKVPLSLQMDEAVQLLSSRMGRVQGALAGNLGQRPFELSYLAGLVHAHKDHPPLDGGLALYSLEMAVPSKFYPEKTSVLPKIQEDITHTSLALPIFDGPNTLITASLNDFGFAGAFIYPLLAVLVFSFIARMLIGRLPPFLYYLATLRLIYMCLYAEAGLSAVLTVGLRNLAIMMLLLLLVWKIPYRRAAGIYCGRRISTA